MSKAKLKAAIKNAFVKQQNPSSTDSALEGVSNDISDAIYDYVVEELEELKKKLLDPGAFTSTPAETSGEVTATNSITPGTITTYKPGIS